MIAQPGPHRKVSNYLVPKNLCRRGDMESRNDILGNAVPHAAPMGLASRLDVGCYKHGVPTGLGNGPLSDNN